MNKTGIAAIAAAAALSGCSIHPLPGDWGGDKTVAIVEKIRCEAALALRDLAVGYLLRDEASGPSRRIGEKFRDGKLPFSKIDFNDLDDEEFRLAVTYDGAAIAMDFTFNITETTKAGASIDFAKMLSGGLLTAGGGGNADFERQNIRNFRLTYDFKGILAGLDPRPDGTRACSGERPGKNPAFPIYGNIGLAEVIETFIQLNEGGQLTSKDKFAGDKGSVPAMVETLEFETKLAAAAKAGLALSRRGYRWQGVGAVANVSAERVNNHKLVVSLSVPPEVLPVRQSKTRVRVDDRVRAKARESARAAIDDENDRRFGTSLRRTLRRLNELSE